MYYFFSNRFFMAALLLTATFCYATSVTQITIGRDSLEGSRYLGEGQIMLAAGRFGMNFLATLFGYGYAEPPVQPYVDLLATVLFVLAAIHFCVLMRKICGERISRVGYGIFACSLISYPLINEIWEYTGANVCVAAGYLLAAGAVYILHDVLYRQELSLKGRIGRLFTASFFCLVICTSYESISVVYVFTVFMVLLLQQWTGERLKFSALMRQGILYASALLTGIVMRVVLHQVILDVFSLTKETGGATNILWGVYPFWNVVETLVKQCIIYYVMRACFYFPILEFVLAVMLFGLLLVITVIRNHRPLMLLTGGGLLFTPFLLPLIQGRYAPYRTCQVFAMLVAMTAMAIYESLKRWKKRHWLKRVCAGAMVFLCLYQSAYLSQLLNLDYIRSEEEAFVIRTIGTDLERQCDITKPIVVTGSYTLGEELLQPVTVDVAESLIYAWFQHRTKWEADTTIKFVDSNVNSVLDWALHAFNELGSAGTAMEKLFRYQGFDFHFELDLERQAEAERYAKDQELPGYPQAGYIVELSDYIIVNLS